MNDRYVDLESKIKALPKISLSEQAENRILLLIQAEQTKVRRKQTQRKWGKSIILASFVIIFILLIPQFPNYISEIKGMFVPQQIEEEWELSPTFDLFDRDGRLVYPDGVRGIEGKIGFLDNGFGLNFAATEPEAGSKMFWYVWGDPDQLIDKELIATAVHQKTGESFILNKTKLVGGLYGEDAHTLTQFEPFPLKGIWKIDIEIDSKPYGSIVINVKDAYVRTKSYRFQGLSKDDLIEGVYLPLHLDGNGMRKLERIVVTAFPINNRKAEKTFYFYNQSGSLYFDQPGKWQLEILDEKTIVDVRAAEAPWEVSPVFQIPELKSDFQGIEGHFAFSAAQQYVVGQEQWKKLGLFWGDMEKYWGKELVITAEQQYTGNKAYIARDMIREPWDGLGTHVVTNFNGFPSSGIWRMDFKIDDELYGSMFVNVKQGYPSTWTGRLKISADDIYTNTNILRIDLYDEQMEEEINVTATFIEDPSITRQFVFTRKQVVTYGADTPDPYYMTEYEGTFNLDREGYWEIDIMGSKSAIFVKP